MADITVDAHPVVAVFRGEQVESSDIIVSSSKTVTLTGVSFGGTVSDVGVPCLIFTASVVLGREFIKGQITEIPEISLDSSTKLGVKLYSCDNKLLNPTSFTTAYFTFDDTLSIAANIDPVESSIYSVIRPENYVGIIRNKTYDVKLHTVDKSGNLAIVLTRKLRFI